MTQPVSALSLEQALRVLIQAERDQRADPSKAFAEMVSQGPLTASVDTLVTTLSRPEATGVFATLQATLPPAERARFAANVATAAELANDLRPEGAPSAHPVQEEAIRVMASALRELRPAQAMAILAESIMPLFPLVAAEAGLRYLNDIRPGVPERTRHSLDKVHLQLRAHIENFLP